MTAQEYRPQPAGEKKIQRKYKIRQRNLDRIDSYLASPKNKSCKWPNDFVNDAIEEKLDRLGVKWKPQGVLNGK